MLVIKFPCVRSERCMDHGLNVLARGLEANKDSSDLWLHYLRLYPKHQDSRHDVLDMCRKALLYAPSHQLHWKVRDDGVVGAAVFKIMMLDLGVRLHGLNIWLKQAVIALAT